MKRMLIDASMAGEVHVAVVDGNFLADYDFEDTSKRPTKGNIYLSAVSRVEPSLQAAFLEYGSERMAFLPLPEVHVDYYKIPTADRDRLSAALRAIESEDGDLTHTMTATDSLDEHFLNDLDIEDENFDNDDLSENSFSDTDVGGDRPEQIPYHEAGRGLYDAQQPVTLPASRKEILLALVDQFLAGAPENIEPVQNNYAVINEMLENKSFPTIFPPNENALADLPQRRERSLTREGAEASELRIARERRNLIRSYKIQEVVKRRQVMLVQITKEERGTKGAAATTYMSLAGRYCVLMPNAPSAGGVSRKISNPNDRRRLKEILSDLRVPDGMSVILRTAGLTAGKEDIARDLTYLLRLWDSIREATMRSNAPALVYEEGDLIKRSIRDLFTDEVGEILITGDEAYDEARRFMQILLPEQMNRVKKYDQAVPLFARYGVDQQIADLHNPMVQLPSGGYMVIHQTEALVAIDVNSGRATRERNIEETAYRTNLEAAVEAARQIRLRDLAGLIVIDFIDMEDHRHRIGVERRMRDAMKIDRARYQTGRISSFGLMELSRQRLRPSVVESHFMTCPACQGSGSTRAPLSTARQLLRALEAEAARSAGQRLTVYAHSQVALLLLNDFRTQLSDLEARCNVQVRCQTDDSQAVAQYKIDRHRIKMAAPQHANRSHKTLDESSAVHLEDVDLYNLPFDADAPNSVLRPQAIVEEGELNQVMLDEPGAEGERNGRARRSRRGGRGRSRRGDETLPADGNETAIPAAAAGRQRLRDRGSRSAGNNPVAGTSEAGNEPTTAIANTPQAGKTEDSSEPRAPRQRRGRGRSRNDMPAGANGETTRESGLAGGMPSNVELPILHNSASVSAARGRSEQPVTAQIAAPIANNNAQPPLPDSAPVTISTAEGEGGKSGWWQRLMKS